MEKVDVVSTSFDTGASYPEANLTISDGSSTLYFGVYFGNKKDCNENIAALQTLADEIQTFIDLVKEHKTEALKASVH
jgi:hypothetical protein